MKKTKILMFALTLMLVQGAFAASGTGFETGFDVQKDALVTGQWKYIGGTWDPGIYPTAMIDWKVHSEFATMSYYNEIEQFGAAYQYKLSAQVGANMPGFSRFGFEAITVNPPETTMGTDHTKSVVQIESKGDFSESKLKVTAFGQTDIDSRFNADSGFHQKVYAKVN